MEYNKAVYEDILNKCHIVRCYGSMTLADNAELIYDASSNKYILKTSDGKIDVNLVASENPEDVASFVSILFTHV